MFLINGNWQYHLPVMDRAFQFGDGCFTTARVLSGQVHLLAQHLQRLRDACQRLMIPAPDWQQLALEMQQLASEHSQAVLKVIISRGSGGRGYSVQDCQCSCRILNISDYPEYYHRWRSQGVKLTLSPVQLGRNPHLAGIKHLNRLEQILIRQQLAPDADEALVLDSENMLVECCAANLFWRQDNRIFTPLLDQCGVSGIMRQHIIDLLASRGWQTEQVRCPLSTLQHASEIVICNALMPILPVRQAQHWQFHSRELYHLLAPLCDMSV